MLISVLRRVALALPLIVLTACSSFPLVQPKPATPVVAAELPPLLIAPEPLAYPAPVNNRLVDEKGNATSLRALPNG